MKKLAFFLIALSLIISSCSSSPSSTDQELPEPNISQSAKATEESTTGDLAKKETVTVSNEQLYKYTNSFDEPTVIYFSEIKNNGTKAIKITDASVDLEDTSGSILRALTIYSTYPRIINPGESGYLAESLLGLNVDSVDLDKVGKAILHFDFKEVESSPDLNVEITETKPSSEFNYPKLTGQIENKSDSDLKDVYVVAVFKDSQGNIQTLTMTNLDSLNSKEKKGFETTSIFGIPDIDYSTSEYQFFSYTTKTIIPFSP